MTLRRIYFYSTAATDNAAYIIAGFNREEAGKGVFNTPQQFLNSRMASGENLVSLFKGVRFMVPFPLVNSQWWLVEQLNLGKFFAHIKSMIIFFKA